MGLRAARSRLPRRGSRAGAPDIAASRKLPGPTRALVAEVVPGSPAAAAGLEAGDVIAAFDGRPVANPRELTRLVAATPPGSHVDVEVARAEGTRKIAVTLAELEDQARRR